MIPKLLRSSLLLAATVFVPAANAAPFLQLDILGGTYIGGNEESVITGDPIFSLYALAERGKKLDDAELLSDEFFISAAVTPNDEFDGNGAPDLGSFVISFVDFYGNLYTDTIDVTDDMVFGVPPLEPTNNHLHDGGDLPQHDTFPTWFSEFKFSFDAANETATYNVQDDGGQGPQSGTGSYYHEFQLDLTNLAAGYQLHFDLYHIKIKNGNDYDVDYHAPFSKDAGTLIIQDPPAPVPAPASIFLIGLGFMAFASMRRRFGHR